MKRTVHCWKGQREYAEERFGWGSDEWAATFKEGGGSNGTCMLADGHDGPHEFTPDNQIAITFS